jgi:hypothetical protein
MTFINPDRPGIEPAELPHPRHNPASALDDQPRMGDGWTANRPRSNGLMLTGGIIVALMIAGWVTFSGMIETASVANTPPTTTSQPTNIPFVSSGAPPTTGQAAAR